MFRIDTAERRRRLQTRHLLTAATRTDDPVSAANAVVALHATDPATVYLSAWARMTRAGLDDVADALYLTKRLVRMMAMRRTMFVVATELAPVVHASCSLAVAATQRRTLLTHLRKAGVAVDVERWLDDVSAGTMAALERRGRASATDLAQDEPRLNTVLDLLPDKAYAIPQKVTSRVLTILALEGRIVRGRPLGGWTTNRNEWWPAGAWLPGGVAGRDADAEIGESEVRAARTELVRRWLRAFGPAPLRDVMWWTGWPAGQVKAALAPVATVEVQLDTGTALLLADDLDRTPEPEPTAALLPGLDPTPMGWVERGWFLGAHQGPLFDRTGNIGPTILWQGRVVGGWAQGPGGEIRIRLLEDIGVAGRAAVDARAAELASRLGELRVTPRFRTPLERELAE